jgi:hypothetical protein
MKKFLWLVFLSAGVFQASEVCAANASVVVNMQAEVPVSIQLSVSPQGQSELRFGNIQPSLLETTEAGPIIVSVQVQTNAGQKYQVTQAVSGSLQNSNGDTISSNNLQYKSTALKSGSTAVASYTGVTGPSQTVYISNDQGDEDTISAEYKLTVPASQPAGDYSTLLTYTASTI